MGYYRAPTFLSGVADETHDDYDAVTIYGVGDYCIVPELKAVYKSSLLDNSDNYPPANPTAWTFWSPLNSYKMLAVDEFIGSKTMGNDVVLEFDFSQATACTMLDCDFVSVLMEQIDNSTGEVIHSKRGTGSTFGVLSWYDYFYNPLNKIYQMHYEGFEWHANSTLRLTFTGAVSIGSLTLGIVRNMGCTLYGTSVTFEDESSITSSLITGFRKVTRYGYIQVIEAKVRFDTEEFNAIAQTVKRIIGKNIVFIPTEFDQFSEMIILGYFEKFPIPLDNPAKITTQTTIIGVA
ncbi:MAG: hypothetical protein DRG30_06345 [Epsilonproteobacteria bacterium]|nr:MAG: hypothetical protein DRG30_06345 [Campylobacterota bacterium]